MFGFVKATLLDDANLKIMALERELEKIKNKLHESWEIINSEDYQQYKTHKDKRNKLLEQENHLNEIRKQCELIIIESKNTAHDILTECHKEKNETLISTQKQAQKIMDDANKTAETIIYAAQLEKTKAINDAKSQAEYILTEKQNEADKKLADLLRYISEKKTENDILLKKKIELKKEIEHLELTLDNHEIIETVTPFQQLIDGPTSDKIKESLDKVKEQQKELMKSGLAFEIKENILWNNNAAQGKAMQKRHGNFLITAFNAEVDNLISNTNLTNFARNAKKIEKWFDKTNKNGDDSFIELNRKLLHLRLEEQRYFFEHKYKKESELEEQRYMKEVLREEEKFKKELESFVLERENEERKCRNEINEYAERLKTADLNNQLIEQLNSQIDELKLKLERATSEKERALSMAQLTRSGYVYIISNKGSFGDNVYKIGMTRRLEPLDRIKELGDASVPFFFDVHAMLPSDDAPSLEKKLHNKFASKRVNKVNCRKEFFYVTFDEIEKALNELTEEGYNLIRDVTSSQLEETRFIESMEYNNV